MNTIPPPAANCGNSLAELGHRSWRAVFKTPTLLAQLCAAAVLAAPLTLPGANEETINLLKLTRFAEPAFPAAARSEGISEGTVTLAISRDAAGVPGDILVIDSTHPALTGAVLEAARHWRFSPMAPGTDLSPTIVRICFRQTGVVFVHPFAASQAGLISDATDHRLREPVKIPQLQSLAQAPKAIHQPMPQYPASLANKAIEGTAKVRFYVDEDGRVRLPQVIEATTPEFAEAAMAAVSQWRYEPPREGSRRVVATDHWSFKFAATN
ncbi:MAG: TonB family protein [Lacunisphaera sp.]|nr:TonB family protein [Lacunisphaera sp.]MDB6166321.1 TonB family protein [Lacunisphaera sp.]